MKTLRFLVGMFALAGFLYAEDNVEVHFNYPADTVFIGETNTVEFWIENDDTILGMTLGFEVSGYGGAVVWDSLYGSHPPLNIEAPEAVMAFMGGITSYFAGYQDSILQDSLLIGGAYLPPDNLGIPSGSLRICYSMQFDIPGGEEMGSLCVDNIFFPPAGAWIFDFGSGPFAPDYFGCVNVNYSNPNCPAVCFPVITKEVQANFGFSPNCGIAPVEIQFSDSSTLNPQAWKWYFDDGDSSTEQNPAHIYQNSGEYYPTLIASNGYNADTFTSPVPVIIYDSLVLDFSSDITEGLAPLEIQFSPTFSPTPDYIVWYFGDGDSSNLPNPTHIYAEAGVYDVIFAAELCGTRDSLVKAGYITVLDYICGDANSDGVVNVADVYFIRSYLFGGGSAPSPLESADVDECGSINVSDMAYLQEYVWAGGPGPCEGSVTCYLPTGVNAITLGCPVEAAGYSGDSVAIPVYLTSDTLLTAFYIGFEYNSADIEITSVDLTGSAIPEYQHAFLQVYIPVGEPEILIGWFENPITGLGHIPAQDSGLLFTMWAQVPAGLPEQSIDIDTTASITGLPSSEILLSPLGGGSIKPDYNDCGTADLIIIYPDYICGDANSDEAVNISDAVWIINYVFAGGDPPEPLESGDANCDGDVNVSDGVWIINYVFAGGNEPCDTDPPSPNGDGIPDC